MTDQPHRAIVYGQHRAIESNIVVNEPGEDAEAELVSRIGNSNSDVWFVLFDGESETRVRRVRRLL